MNDVDQVTIYNDRGDPLAEGIPIDALSPYRNQAIRAILHTLKRTAIIDLNKLETSLQNGSVGNTMAIGGECRILGREVDLPIKEHTDSIADRVLGMLRVSDDDDTVVEKLDSLLIVQIPSLVVATGIGYTQAHLLPATALAHAIIDEFGLGIFDGVDMIKSAIMGRYPQTIEPSGGAVSTLISFPTNVEGAGVGYRSLTVNTIVALTHRRTFDAVALSSALEHAAAFESGAATGPYRRYHLLGMAYQGFNAGNMVYELVRDHGKGTVLDIIEDVIARSIEDRVIKLEKELPSGYGMYAASDASMWNAYASAGLLATAIQNAGASRSAQGTPSAMQFYADLLAMATSLPEVDFGRVIGTATAFNWLTHNSYGGGEVGIFSGEHVVTKGSKGFIIPCAAASMCLDAGTMMYMPEVTSKNIFKLSEVLPGLQDPLLRIAEAAKESGG
jgi:methyl-coenzyme M reductase beta subunit